MCTNHSLLIKCKIFRPTLHKTHFSTYPYVTATLKPTNHTKLTSNGCDNFRIMPVSMLMSGIN